MWGSKAETYSVKPRKANTMKWHLVDEDSLEERTIQVGYGINKCDTTRTYGALMCGGHKYDWVTYYIYNGKSRRVDNRIPLVFKDIINLNGSGVCVYCKNFRLKELGLNIKVMG